MTRATSTSTAPACPPPASHGADTIISSSSMGSNSSSTSSRIGRRQRRRLAHVGTLALLALAPLLLGSCCQAFLVPAHAPTGPCSAAASLARRRHVGWAGQSALLRSGEGSGLRMAPLFAKGATTKAATGGGRGRRRAAAAPEEEGDEAKENTTMLLGSQDEEAGGDVDALILGSGEVDEAGEGECVVWSGRVW